MGQYYKPVCIEKKQWLYSHDFDNGLKLMEHSYVGNNFVGAVEKLLLPGGAWYKTKIVWAGDYADPEAGAEKEEENLYHVIGVEKYQIKPEQIPATELKEKYFLVNHTTQEYIDMKKVKDIPDSKGWKIHPLPLLTCEGNGRGGGDFHGEDYRIGMWARNRISIELTAPEGYEEIDGNFIEER